MTFSGMPTTIPPLMTLKNRSSGDSQTLMGYAGKRVQGSMISELTHETRSFLLQELGWNPSKVEELLLPIIQKIQKRNQVCLGLARHEDHPFLTPVPSYN